MHTHTHMHIHTHAYWWAHIKYSSTPKLVPTECFRCSATPLMVFPISALWSAVRCSKVGWFWRWNKVKSWASCLLNISGVWGYLRKSRISRTLGEGSV